MAPKQDEAWSVGVPICCHSWNKDHSLVAACPTGTEVLILRPTVSEDKKPGWTRVCTLQKHEGQVSAVDWAAESNRIVTASWDGNAYVWEGKTETTWVPTLVQLRSSRAVLCAAWSPSEKKFAVGSGARTVSVCYYDNDNKWWASKVIRKKHESSVTSTAWHPNNMLLATTCTDNKCRIFSAAIKDVDAKPSAADSSTGFAPSKFGEQLLELDLALGWAFGVAWSPSGANLAFTGHDSSIHFVNDVGPNLAVHSLHPRCLPLRDVCFLSDTVAVAAGFNGTALLYKTNAEGSWSLAQTLDASNVQSSEHKMGKGENEKLVHSGPVLSIRRGHHETAACAKSFTTAGMDGKLVMWNVPEEAIEALVEKLTVEET